MNKPATLSIEQTLDSKTNTCLLLLSGDIDVSAGLVFDNMPVVPPSHKVVLDFAAVGRVNSMGLAQLMRHLEQWKEAGIQTEAINLNRMVSMLFKMTGLNRYFGDVDPASPPSSELSTRNDESSKPKSRSRTAQFRRVKRKNTNTPPAPEPANEKMHFLVSLQNNQQLSGWYFLNTLMQRHLDRAISIDMNLLGKQSTPPSSSLVFAKPFDACALITHHGYIPVARPVDDTVEVSIVVREEDKHKTITDFKGASVATSTESSFVFLLGRFLCDEYGLDSSGLHYQFTGNQFSAIRKLLQQDVDMLFILKKKFDLLSDLSRYGTHTLEATDTGMAYHMLLLAPTFAALQKPLSDWLLNLQHDEQGQDALDDLGIRAWVTPEPAEIAMLQMLYSRYVS